MTEVCENIGPAQRRRRLNIGIASLAVAAAVVAVLVSAGAARSWRLLALPPIWVGALCLIEARMRTCVVLAARGVRNLDAGDQTIEDDNDRLALIRRSRWIYLWTAVVALLLSALAVAMPMPS